MQTIKKSNASRGAKLLEKWRKENPNKSYKQLDGEIRRTVRQSLIKEQNCLCAYCNCVIDNDSSHIDHLIPKGGAHAQQNKQLDYNNLLASCNRKTICGEKKRDYFLPLTPLMSTCETELKFYVTGEVEATSERATETLRLLGLDCEEKQNRWLVIERETALDALLYAYYSDELPDKNDLFFEDESLLQLLKEDLLQTDNENCLQPYTPILINILNQILPK